MEICQSIWLDGFKCFLVVLRREILSVYIYTVVLYLTQKRKPCWALNFSEKLDQTDSSKTKPDRE